MVSATTGGAVAFPRTTTRLGAPGSAAGHGAQGWRNAVGADGDGLPDGDGETPGDAGTPGDEEGDADGVGLGLADGSGVADDDDGDGGGEGGAVDGDGEGGAVGATGVVAHAVSPIATSKPRAPRRTISRSSSPRPGRLRREAAGSSPAR
jgi:hypothetical protein